MHAFHVDSLLRSRSKFGFKNGNSFQWHAYQLVGSGGTDPIEPISLRLTIDHSAAVACRMISKSVENLLPIQFFDYLLWMVITFYKVS